MKITAKLSKLSLLLATVMLVACGTTMPPAELVSARAAYAHAEASKAKELQPTQLYEAKQALDAAETKFKDEGVSPDTKDLSYVAQRKAEYAETQAQITQAQQAYEQADKDMRALTGKELENYQQKVAQQQADLEKQKQDLEHQKQMTEAEKANAAQARADAEKEHQARLEAERRMKQAIEDLAKIAAVKDEQRGMVITLTGNVLFASGKWELLPGAQIKLNEVAEALKAQKDRDITVEGHTDNQGTPSSNLQLGQRRADSVRSYLVSRGVDANRITATGIGQARPIADNSTPEGRANNRRVEIIISPPKEAR
jgi:outer membrane protein OmpA-like peptidoglycan-associated protein